VLRSFKQISMGKSGKNVNGKHYEDFAQSLFIVSQRQPSKLYVIANVKTHDFLKRLHNVETSRFEYTSELAE
jgi:hypothetical protein